MSGLQVSVAYSGEAALASLARTHHDAVLLAIGLPDINGYEVCRRIRAGVAKPQPVVIALTGWGQEKDRDEAAAAGFDAHLAKPADPGPSDGGAHRTADAGAPGPWARSRCRRRLRRSKPRVSAGAARAYLQGKRLFTEARHDRHLRAGWTVSNRGAGVRAGEGHSPMKALLVLLASAGLSGCVAYDPAAYGAPYSDGAYGSPYGTPYVGPYSVDPPLYHYGGPVLPYGYGWGGYGYDYRPAYPYYHPHGPQPRHPDTPGARPERPARPAPPVPEGGGSGWSPADIRGGGGGAGASGGGGSGWSPGQR